MDNGILDAMGFYSWESVVCGLVRNEHAPLHKGHKQDDLGGQSAEEGVWVTLGRVGCESALQIDPMDILNFVHDHTWRCDTPLRVLVPRMSLADSMCLDGGVL